MTSTPAQGSSAKGPAPANASLLQVTETYVVEYSSLQTRWEQDFFVLASLNFREL